jgi:hypothetical protein
MPVVLLNSRIVGDPEVGQKRANRTYCLLLRPESHAAARTAGFGNRGRFELNCNIWIALGGSIPLRPAVRWPQTGRNHRQRGQKVIDSIDLAVAGNFFSRFQPKKRMSSPQTT